MPLIVLVIKVIPLDETTSEELGGGVKNQTFTLDLPEGLKQAGGESLHSLLKLLMHVYSPKIYALQVKKYIKTVS